MSRQKGESLEVHLTVSSQNALPSGELGWFALVVEPDHERSVAGRLRRKGLDAYLPVRMSCIFMEPPARIELATC